MHKPITRRPLRLEKLSLSLLLFFVYGTYAQDFSEVLPGEERAANTIRGGIPIPAPARDRVRGEGPFDTLIIKDVMLINGEGAPPRGPVSIVVSGDRIDSISNSAPDIAGAEIINGNGMYALPGFIDAHTHIGTPGQGLTGPITPPSMCSNSGWRTALPRCARLARLWGWTGPSLIVIAARQVRSPLRE